ncbi:restriction endonuclease subunit S [uncultured Pontibacter sp.]|uniref:restriction endonuclease subunit S n=1 Tax=uncultured Pontibacter sp. TaxID=453356 RepID=UPI002609117E|nr:restriction endonuclease subunit S [uncultured Pontibacter sp.]
MAKLKTYKLGELTTWKSGGTPPKLDKKYWGGTIPWISAKNLTSYAISTSDVFITQAGLEKGSRLANENSILLLVRGSGLFNDIPVGIVSKPVAFNQDVKAIEVDKAKLDPWYLLYWIKGNKALLNTKLEATGIGAGKFDINILRELEINLPPLSIQRKVADIARCCDDKIELNRRMNQTLEQMAQTLFRQYFVDGIDEKNLPEGWQQGTLEDVIDIKHGYAFKGEFFSDDPTENILVTPGNFRIGGGFNTKKYKFYKGSIPEDYILAKDDLVVTMTDLSKDGDTLGYSALVPTIPNKLLLHNQRIGKVIYKSDLPLKFYLYWLMRSDSYRATVLGSASGSTVKHTSPSRILEYKCIIPDSEALLKFEEQVKELYEKEHANQLEIITLTQLRDTLLPKLMSGEIDVMQSKLSEQHEPVLS